MNKRLLGYISSGNVIKFYKSKEWRKKRLDIFDRDNKECQMCKAKGGFAHPKYCHHIKHLKDYPLLGLTDSNLISLCETCHNVVHPEKFGNNKVEKFSNEERW